MSKRLKAIYSNKIFDSLCDVVSEDKVAALGDKAGDMAVRAHQQLFDRFAGKENAPYSPGWLFTEQGAAAMSGVMGSLLRGKQPLKQPRKRRESHILRTKVEDLDPLAKRLYDKYARGKESVDVDKGEMDAGGGVSQKDAGKVQEEPKVTQGDGGPDNRPCKAPLESPETCDSETETSKASEEKANEGVVVGGIRRVFDRIVLASTEERIAQIRALCNFGDDIDDMDILTAEHEVRGFA